MKIKAVGNQTCEAELTREELRIIHQALNEVCNGINFSDSEFSTRLGTERKSALDLMDKVGRAFEVLDKQ